MDHREALEGILLQLQQGGGNPGAAVVVFVFGVLFDLDFFVLGQRLDILVGGIRVDQAIDQFVDAHFVAGHLAGGFEHLGNRRRAGRNGHDHVLQAVLDALGDFDLAFARQELDRAHLAHVHAHRVGGAAEFRVNRGQCLFGLFLDFGGIHRRRCRFVEQQVFDGGRFVENLDRHVVEGGDDRFDLLRIHQVVGQVVVDLGVGQVAALLAQRDQGLQPGALGVEVDQLGFRGDQFFTALAAARLGDGLGHRFGGQRLGSGFGGYWRDSLRSRSFCCFRRCGLGRSFCRGLGRSFGGSFCRGLGRRFCRSLGWGFGRRFGRSFLRSFGRSRLFRRHGLFGRRRLFGDRLGGGL
jgi:hypothetical protein